MSFDTFDPVVSFRRTQQLSRIEGLISSHLLNVARITSFASRSDPADDKQQMQVCSCLQKGMIPDPSVLAYVSLTLMDALPLCARCISALNQARWQPRAAVAGGSLRT